MRLCITCGEREATRPIRKPAHWRKSYCGVCWQQRPCNQRAQYTSLNPQRRAYNRVAIRRRLFIGARYIGYAKTETDARRIKAHIRSRVHGFIAGQSARAEAQSSTSRAVPITPNDRTD